MKNPKSCDQCEPLSIQGVFCHEIGCYNMGKKWNYKEGKWERFIDCSICGYEVKEGEACNCSDDIE